MFLRGIVNINQRGISTLLFFFLFFLTDISIERYGRTIKLLIGNILCENHQDEETTDSLTDLLKFLNSANISYTQPKELIKGTIVALRKYSNNEALSIKLIESTFSKMSEEDSKINSHSSCIITDGPVILVIVSGNEGAIEAIIKVIERHITSTEACKQGCEALSELCIEGKSNEFYLLRLVYNFITDKNKARLWKIGGIDVVLKALKEHIDDMHVCILGLKALILMKAKCRTTMCMYVFFYYKCRCIEE